MKIKLTSPIMIDGTPHKADATVTVDETLGRNLIYREKAVEVSAEDDTAEGASGKKAK